MLVRDAKSVTGHVKCHVTGKKPTVSTSRADLLGLLGVATESDFGLGQPVSNGSAASKRGVNKRGAKRVLMLGILPPSRGICE